MKQVVLVGTLVAALGAGAVSVSAQFAPAITRTSANGMSVHGFAERSMPKALLFPAAAETMHSRPL